MKRQIVTHYQRFDDHTTIEESMDEIATKIRKMGLKIDVLHRTIAVNLSEPNDTMLSRNQALWVTNSFADIALPKKFRCDFKIDIVYDPFIDIAANFRDCLDNPKVLYAPIDKHFTLCEANGEFALINEQYFKRGMLAYIFPPFIDTQGKAEAYLKEMNKAYQDGRAEGFALGKGERSKIIP